jgi:hypothetical protein
MSAQDAGFEQLLADQNKGFQDAEAFDNWMPSDGQYTMIIKTVKSIVLSDKTTGKKDAGWRFSLIVVNPADPSMHNRECSSLFTMKVPGILKSLAIILSSGAVNANTGLAEANTIFLGSQGKAVLVEVSTNAKGYKNLKIVEIIPLDSEAPTT